MTNSKTTPPKKPQKTVIDKEHPLPGRTPSKAFLAALEAVKRLKPRRKKG